MIFLYKPKSFPWFEKNPNFWGEAWRGLLIKNGLLRNAMQERSLSLASPCEIEKLYITIEDCYCSKGTDKTHPLFEITNKKTDKNDNVVDFDLEKVGDFNDCRDFELTPREEFGDAQSCIIIRMEMKDSFCTSYPGLPVVDSDKPEASVIKDVTIQGQGDIVTLPATTGDTGNTLRVMKDAARQLFGEDTTSPYWPR